MRFYGLWLVPWQLERWKVVNRSRGEGYGPSLIFAKLGANTLYTVQNFGDFGSLTISIGSITLNSNSKSWADVTIQYGDAPTDAPVVAPTDAPVVAPTVAPVVAPTDAPVVAPTACNECSNDRTPWMKNNEVECYTYSKLNKKCKNNQRWTDNNYCQLSCFFNEVEYED